jgi:hypothetical protein
MAYGRAVRVTGRRLTAKRAAPLLVVAAAVIGVVALAFGTELRLRPPGPAPRGAHGYDISWPQCSGSAAGVVPPGDPPYVIVGLTDGTGAAPNPCLDDQVAWAREHGTRIGVYLVAAYPSAAQLAAADDGPLAQCGAKQACRLRNVGAAEAAQAMSTIRGADIHPPLVWVDVEFRSDGPWSHHVAANLAVLQGIARGLRSARMRFGVYTTPLMWTDITGNYPLQVPNWLPTGDRSPRHARALCERTATGGPTWLVQYTRTLDEDLTCRTPSAPGKAGELSRFASLR